jgi:uncharacterized protein
MKATQQLLVKTGLKAGMANPASEFCGTQGGTTIIVSDASGNEYGLCRLPGNKTFEEWNYYNTCAPSK